MLGVERGRVVLEKHDDSWKENYDSEKKILLMLEDIKNIEHIGSTSIVGIAAKPIIDMIFEYEEYTDMDSMIEKIEGLGYEHLGERGVEGRSFFVKRIDGKSHYHLSGYVEGDRNFDDYIIFRDYLNENEKYRDEYEKLKNKLYLKYEGDRKRYTLGKAIYIKFILKRAKI